MGRRLLPASARARSFFGAQTGAGNFTGTGTVYYIGDLRPGNSPASVHYGGDVVFGGTTTLPEAAITP
jgi:hypothetical protein